MSTLNPQQLAVIAHGDTPALVLAGAGTGKTTVMAHRAAELLQRGLNPNRLLLLTITRRAAEELRERVSRVLKLGSLALPWCGTFHSIAVRLLRRQGEHIGVPNTFYGASVTVAGLLSGADLRQALLRLPGEPLRDIALSPRVFNADGLTLDGLTLDDLAAGQPHRVHVGQEDGFIDFWRQLG